VRDYGNMRSSTLDRDEQATATGTRSGKRTLTELLPATSSLVQRKADAAPAMPTGPRPSIAALFSRGAERQPSVGREPDTGSRPSVVQMLPRSRRAAPVDPQIRRTRSTHPLAAPYVR
jgi:hypothetical protein